jgi:mono/diheme cytochrome c family protein
MLITVMLNRMRYSIFSANQLAAESAGADFTNKEANTHTNLTHKELEGHMEKRVFKWLMIAVVVGFNTSGWAQQLDEGKTEFLSSCASCHGTDGKGKGPVSAELKATPPDLTVLAKKNNGVFPVAAVFEIIDGRKSVSAHGTGEMPVWGFRYRAAVRMNVAPTVAPTSEVNRILSRNVEFIVRSRILAVVDYLNRIQEK